MRTYGKEEMMYERLMYGYRHFPNYVLLRKATAVRQKRRASSLEAMLYYHDINLDGMRSMIDSSLGTMRHACCYGLVKKTGLLEIREKYIGAAA